MSELPEVSVSDVRKYRADYDAVSQEGGQKAAQACFTYVWALVHSVRKSDAESGMQLAEIMNDSEHMDNSAKKDLIYFRCVALYRLGRYIDARTQLTEFLRTSPNHRQACVLKDAVEEKLVRDGLIGVGVVTGLGVVAAGIAAVILGGRR